MYQTKKICSICCLLVLSRLDRSALKLISPGDKRNHLSHYITHHLEMVCHNQQVSIEVPQDYQEPSLNMFDFLSQVERVIFLLYAKCPG